MNHAAPSGLPRESFWPRATREYRHQDLGSAPADLMTAQLPSLLAGIGVFVRSVRFPLKGILPVSIAFGEVEQGGCG